MRHWLALTLILVSLVPAQLARADSPVVVELYTSQGCSACPPADALLEELAARDDVIALALHVDYWDYIGWADTFASAQFTRRQHAYARAAGSRMVYTPQMIIGGQARVVGYEPMNVADVIHEMRMVDYPVAITMERTSDGVTLRAEASMVIAEGPGMVVQLVRYIPLQQVDIRRGENAGRSIDYVNIVTEWQRIGEDWSGAEPFEMQLIDSAQEPIVAIVQMAGPGRILGAARLD